MKISRLFSTLMVWLAILTSCFQSFAVDIRQPDRSEVENIVRVFRGYISWNKFDFETVSNNLNNIFIAYEGSNMVACLRISKIAPSKIHINDLATIKEARGKGYGKGLILYIKQQFPNVMIDLTPTTRSIDFYLKQGFEYDKKTKIMWFPHIPS